MAFAGSDAWHTELLRQMALDVPDVRPAVIGFAAADQLDEYRKFRHRIRNIYLPSYPERMAHLVLHLPTLWPRIRSELEFFARFLRGLANADAG